MNRPTTQAERTPSRNALRPSQQPRTAPHSVRRHFATFGFYLAWPIVVYYLLRHAESPTWSPSPAAPVDPGERAHLLAER